MSVWFESMATRTAIQIHGPGDARVISGVPMPRLRDDFIIVKPEFVALNPTDTWHIDDIPSPGAIVGCDYSGVVQEVGSAVTNFQRGDRVAGFAHGGILNPYPEDGYPLHRATAHAWQSLIICVMGR